MGVFDLSFRRDLSCGSPQGKGSGPSSSDGNGGLGLGHTGGKGVYNQWIHCDLIVIF